MIAELVLIIICTVVYFFMSYLEYPRLVIKGDKCYIVRGFNEYFNMRMYTLYGIHQWTNVPNFTSILSGEKIFKELRGIK